MRDLPHHDGSGLYVSDSAPRIGDLVTLRVRVPKRYHTDEIHVRVMQDGEPVLHPMKREKSARAGKSSENWWSAQVVILNKRTNYRFLFKSGRDHAWLNGAGHFEREVVDHFDFKIVAHRHPPQWLKKAVFYQIFPDRFAKSDSRRELPAWAISRSWDEIPARKQSEVSEEFYGGDLIGVLEKLDHIVDLGVSGIYFTPMFPSGSNHRYDAYSFDHIDPLLGGDQALIDLKRSCERVGIRVVGDLTTNHCGIGHPWIKSALGGSSRKYRDYFYWSERSKWGYVGWWDVESLPKLNYGSKSLRDDMWGAKDSIVRKWLRSPFNLDGWRIDVGNMTGRYMEDDFNAEVAESIRHALEDVNPEAWLVAENADFFAEDLAGLGWHGTMNHAGFTRPVWQWLNVKESGTKDAMGMPLPLPQVTGGEMVEILREFSGSIPWRSLISSMILLSSHDRARFQSVVAGKVRRNIAGVTMLMTYPGVPSIYAGDEIGLEGLWGENGRRTMPWSDRSKWNEVLLLSYRELIALRGNSPALTEGGMRWIHVEDDAVAYLRECEAEALLIVVARKGVSLNIDLSRLGYSLDETLFGPVVASKRFRLQSREAVSGIWRLRAC